MGDGGGWRRGVKVSPCQRLLEGRGYLLRGCVS